MRRAQAAQATMQRDRMEAMLRREVGHDATAARLLASDATPPSWRGRAQTIALMRERMQALQEQHAAACAAGRLTGSAHAAAPMPEAAPPSGAGGGAAGGAAADDPTTPGCGALSTATALPAAAAVRGRHDAAHRAHISTMSGTAQVGASPALRMQCTAVPHASLTRTRLLAARA